MIYEKYSTDIIYYFIYLNFEINKLEKIFSMCENYKDIKNKFIDIFQELPEITVRAPGRVNFIGEHIDYNGGLVLPLAIKNEICIALKRRHDKDMRLISLQFKDEYEGSIPHERINSPFWTNYIFGVWQEFHQGYQINEGFDAIIDGDVPVGSGLSSSAAIEVAVAWALNLLYQIKIDRLTIAKLCQRAENKFVGVNCGLMDQAASACCEKNHALLLDCFEPSFSQINFSFEDNISILIAHSGLGRKLSNSEYNLRRSECEKALKLINQLTTYNYNNLSSIPISVLNDILRKIPADIFKRARHVITEQERVKNVCQALEQHNWKQTGDYLNQSHFSLKDDYEVSCEELDELTNLLRSYDGVYGSRLTGAGFGGCTISLINSNARETIIEKVKKDYYQKRGFIPLIFTSSAENGVSEINIC